MNYVSDTPIDADKPQGTKRTFHEAGQIVLVFQGGRALGAYQAGVYQCKPHCRKPCRQAAGPVAGVLAARCAQVMVE